MLPFFFTRSKVQQCKPTLLKGYVDRLLHPRILQMLKHIFLSALLISGSITVFTVSATYLAIKPLDFTAPTALPIQAEVGHSMPPNFQMHFSSATCVDYNHNGTFVRRCNG